MHALEDRRQNDSARHYLDLGTSFGALRTTLHLAAQSVGFPVAMLNIVDSTERHTILTVGMPDQPSAPRFETLCGTVFCSGSPTVVPDLAVHQGRELPAIQAKGVRAYVGIPITGREGLTIGTLCLVDFVSHSVDEEELLRLEQFATVVEDQLERLRRYGPSRSHEDVRELARSMDDGQIVPWFQPLVDLRTEKVVAYEALARWEHPSRGLLPPSEFIPLAEDSDLIIDLDLVLLRRAAHFAREWRRCDPELRVSVNISSQHFQRCDCVARLYEAVTSACLQPEAIILELTETSVFDFSDTSIAHLTELRALGFQIALDDFGAGCSTLEHLVYLPCDSVKIDCATTEAMRTHSGLAVVRAVAGLAGELGLPVVVEGIESPEQATWSKDLGCSIGQGHLWSPPMPAEAVCC